MSRFGIFSYFIILHLTCNGQNVEIFSPPNDAVITFETNDGLITVYTAHNKFIRTGINSYEQHFEGFNYSDLETNEEWVDRIEVVNGRLEIHHRPVISIIHLDTSVRAVNLPYVGTYNGVIYKGKVLQGTDYCSNEIRIYKDTAYACFDGLLVYYKDALIHTYNGNIVSGFIYYGHDLGLIQDIVVTPKFWITLTSDGVFKLNRQTHEVDTLLFTGFQVGQNSRFTNDLYGWHKNYWFQLDTLTYELTILDTLPSTIKHVDERKMLFTTENQVITNEYKYGSYTLLKGAFHSAEFYDENLLFLSSNSGLILYNRIENTLDTIIKAEFNANSLYRFGDTLYAGGVSGLWKIDLSNLNKLPSYSLRHRENWLNTNLGPILSGILLVLGLAFFFIGRAKTKLRPVYTPITSDLRTISEYIDNNIQNVTINSLMTKFNLSQNALYEKCQPLTPGELIRNKRIELIKENLSSKSVSELSKISGFSKEYLQRKVLPELRK